MGFDGVNELSFRVTDDNGLSIGFLFDGQPLEKLRESDVELIPYWEFESEMPYYRLDEEPIWKLIGVCSCGDGGCGSAGCKIVEEEDFVIFKEIFADGYRFPDEVNFRFTKANYESVIKEILKVVDKYKKQNG